MFQNIIVIVALVSVFHLSIAADPINPADINSFVQLADLTSENGDQPGDQNSAIDSLIEQMKTAIEWVNNVVGNSLNPFSTSILIGKQADLKVEKLDQYQGRVDGLFSRFRAYISDYHKYNEHTINEFVDACTNNDTGSLQETLRDIYTLAVPENVEKNPSTPSPQEEKYEYYYYSDEDESDSDGDSPSIFQYIQQILDGAPVESKCGRDVSVHQRLFETYNAIVLTEAKGHIMSMFSYRWQKIKQNVSNEQEIKKVGANLVIRAEEYLLTLKSALPAASRTYRRCDPKQHRRGATFNELEGLIQYIIILEPDANKGAYCSYTCENMPAAYPNKCDPNDHWCTPRPCEGIVQNCFSIGNSDVCLAGPDEAPRYQNFIDREGNTYGPIGNCRHDSTKVTGWWRGAYYCDVCVCVCIEENRPSKAIRAFILRPRLSDIDKNMVITGVRIVAVTRVIQLQIRQAKLLPNGRIDPKTETWVKNERFERTEEVYGGGFYLLKDKDEKELMKISEDHTFIWTEQRFINLDDLFGDPNYLVTGIKFGLSDPNNVDENNWNLSPIQLEIRVTEFDYDSGLLGTEVDSSKWIKPEDMKGRSPEYDHERKPMSVYNLNLPTRSPINVPDSHPNQRIKFDRSHKWFDAGQCTLPFFDSVPVTGLSVPLSGIGLFHKGNSEYGGFLSLRTYSVDLSNRLKSKMKSDDANKYKADFSDPMPYDVEIEQ